VSLISNGIILEIPTSPTSPNPKTAADGRGIRFVTGPADGIPLVNSILKMPNHIAQSPELANFDSLQVLQPIASYNLLAPETTHTGRLSAQAAGYDYLVKAAGKGAASILISSSTSGQSRMDRLSFASQTDPMVHALDQLAANEQVRTGSYEARFLQVFGLIGNGPVTVIWLVSDTYPGVNDLFYEPVFPNPNLKSKLQTEKLYSASEFLKAARGNGQGPKPTAAAALDLVQSTLLNTDYVDARHHSGLFKNLNDLGSSARAVSEDNNDDTAATAAKNEAFFDSLRKNISNSIEITNRANESPVAKKQSDELRKRLQAIYQESGR
jgi:hypothetical protein